MKKLMLYLLCGLFLLLLTAGCGQKDEPKTETPAVEEAAEEVTMDDTTTAVDSTAEAVDKAVEKVTEGGH